ncbi:MAG: hypothetical protein ABIO82_02305 [Ginsengibacter sp.]
MFKKLPINDLGISDVKKPNSEIGIGIDSLPTGIKQSKIFAGNDLEQLANVNEIPFVDPSYEDEKLKNIFQYYSIDPDEMESELHQYAAALLHEGKVYEAWQVLLAIE